MIILRPGFDTISIGQLAQLATAPLFAAFMRAALNRREGRNPQLIDLDRPTDTRV